MIPDRIAATWIRADHAGQPQDHCGLFRPVHGGDPAIWHPIAAVIGRFCAHLGVKTVSADVEAAGLVQSRRTG